MPDSDLRKCLETCAEALAGRRVLLRFREPPKAGASGEAYRPADAPTLALIDISPRLSGPEQFRVFLHECAHVALGHVDRVKPTPPEDERSGAIDFVTSKRWFSKPKDDPRELEADELAGKWQAWAEKQTAARLSPGDPWPLKLSLYLVALQFYNWE